ncbi:tRNA dihydrouridine synthase [Agarilytica rhodophyticola]|uniref:tRNA dihydrouridine synthase n=1 Tax=Agarilytica rhodophyticola TaxID=1737490 RepID=UPI000B349422|nr:tRNA-dihydrouridine synthase family protein [Agarilytica rhodophyticola]
MRIFLAPMEGVVDHHLRNLMRRIGGIDICVTEFVRVTDHVLPRKVFTRYSPELVDVASQQDNQRCPTRVQLLGSNPEAIAANARKAARLGAPGIDLNFGCPAKTVNKNRGGACLLDEPNTLYEIVSQTRRAVQKDVPVTAKIRLGYQDRSSYLENAQAIYEAGATELVVHARSKTDGYKPPAYWEYLAKIRETIDIPVVANGEIWSLQDYQRCKQVSGCQDVMLGRGLLAKPDLALAIKAYEAGRQYQDMGWSQVAAILLEFFEITCQVYAKKYTGNRLKQWLFYLKRQYPEANTLFEKIKREREYEVLRNAVAAYL